jgi:hypothetical protein
VSSIVVWYLGRPPAVRTVLGRDRNSGTIGDDLVHVDELPLALESAEGVGAEGRVYVAVEMEVAHALDEAVGEQLERHRPVDKGVNGEWIKV